MQRILAPTLAILAAVVLACGCSGNKGQGEQSAESKAKEKPALFRNDLNALDRAKGLEGAQQQDAARQRQMIENQSR